MGASLQSYKNYIKELILEELLEIYDSDPFKNNFNFTDFGGYISTGKFEDPQNNNIEVLFHKLGNNLYELDFLVNQSSYSTQDSNYNTKDYSKLLITVAKAVTQFLDEIQPRGLSIDGNETENFKKLEKKPQSQGQKNRLYNYFISKINPKDDYGVGKNKNGTINIMRRSK